MGSSFLEAHYYEGGLRHRDYSLGTSRPAWAPPADVVGFADEFMLAADTAAVEVRRLLHNERRLTWIAVYHASVDARLGDRRNHAGMGIWLDELTVADARSLLHGLDVIARKLAESVNPDGVAAPATEFLRDFVPKYLLPLGELPNLPGLIFASGRLSATRLAFVQTEQPLGESRLVGDEVLAALYSAPQPEDASRQLICVSRSPLSSRDESRFHKVSDADDAASKILQALPSAMAGLNSKLAKTAAELDKAVRERDVAMARSSEYDMLQDRLRSFESDPLNVVLGAVREVSNKLETLNVRTEPARPIEPSIYWPTSPRRVIVHPKRPIAEDEPHTQQIDLFWIFILGLALLFFGTILYLLIDRFAGSLL
jgi:hypothetical protein